MSKLATPMRPRKGAALIEYGLIVGLIAVTAIGSVSQLGRKTQETFNSVSETLSQNMALVTSAADAGAAQWNVFNPNAVTGIEFTPAVMTSASGWYGYYAASGEGIAIKKMGVPEMVGTHFNPASGGALHVNFANLDPSFIADNRMTCRSETNSDIFSSDLSAGAEGSHSGYPYLRFSVASLPELDINEVDAANPHAILCEVLPR